jgi:hypothetical protein
MFAADPIVQLREHDPISPGPQQTSIAETEKDGQRQSRSLGALFSTAGVR